MPNQPTLFEQPLSHKDDVITSYEAADKLIKSGKLSRQEQGVYNDICRYIIDCNHKDFTPKEITGCDYPTIQRRLSGLRNADKIERLNTKGERYQENKGQELMKRNNCAVWRIIERR